jgi:hypothetical protein
MVFKMRKLLLAIIFLSVEAQRLKINLRENIREEVEISSINDVGSYQETEEPRTYRLPNDTRPEVYLINLNFGEFHEDDLSFTGNVKISIRVIEQTDTIILHSSVDDVSETSLVTEENAQLFHTITYDENREFMIVKTSQLSKGSLVRLTVNYRGTIGTSISGIYRGSYLNSANERRCLL